MIRSRLSKSLDEDALKLTSSLEHDKYIFKYDILVDYAHVLGLLKVGLISREDAKRIFEALREVEKLGLEKLVGEDVHEAIESKVVEIAKESGMKMHTARSRNDEVATCLRLFAREKIIEILSELLELRKTFLEKAREYFDCIMPGFTHLQYAQPTKLSHYLIAYHDAIKRDFERGLEVFGRVNKSPLGGAAFASTPHKLDREYVADLLGFDGVVENSMDASASRDFLIESLFFSTSVMLDLSRFCEEIILWASEFNFVELPDEFSSSSSIMPQKKNPDVAEIIRAKAGKSVGYLASACTILKALPYAYNRDFQEMNSLLYVSMNECLLSVRTFRKMFSALKFKEEVMREKASKGLTLATDLADLLVKKGVPFRLSHKIVGSLVKKNKIPPKAEELVKEVESFGVKIEVLEEELKEWLDVEKSLERRKNIGGTAKEELERMIKEREREISEDEEKLKVLKSRIEERINFLMSEVERVCSGRE